MTDHNILAATVHDQAGQVASSIRSATASRRVERLQELAAVRVLNRMVGGHACRISSSGKGEDSWLLNHPKFAVEMDRRFPLDLVKSLVSSDPEMAVGEGFMDGRWSVVRGNLEDVLFMMWNAAGGTGVASWVRKAINRGRFKRWQTNTPEQARRNIAYHYDAQNVDNVLFAHMLGDVPVYSAALFDDAHQDLASAQRHKIEVITQKLRLGRDDRVLDVGSGWGVLTRRLANEGVHATGITLSQEQLRFCEENISRHAKGSERYLLKDYREFFAGNTEPFDAITCIEVLDHIGKQQFEPFFRLVRDHLRPEGTFFLQLIARPRRGQTSGWIHRHVYPGGYIASLEEVQAAYQSAGFAVESLDRLAGAHYAQTLREWRKLLVENRNRIESTGLVGDAFYRKWLFFLAYSIIAFDHSGFCNYHLKLRKM